MPLRYRRLFIGLTVTLILVLGGLWLLGREVGKSYQRGAEGIGVLFAEGIRQLERVDTATTRVPPGSRIQLGPLVVGELRSAVRVATDTARAHDTAWVSARRVGPVAALANAQASMVYVGALDAPELRHELHNNDGWSGHLDSLQDGTLIIRLERRKPAAGQVATAQLYLPQDTLSILVF
jgi:hypothetical protein